MVGERANPDELLRRIEAENRAKHYGKLKIFFGYAAGVGKTYSMLEAAHLAKKNGIDVVVGYVEPHMRPETTALLRGLELVPNTMIKHKGIELREFDLDYAIKRKPQIILVDELAHTNADGSRHKKRYQDVAELLKAGIDVYTTINVQHIESLNDMVASITGVMVRERIPDHVFDNADQVELVDIEPEELIERLNRGKIYKERQAKQALGNFFSVENLVALREISLRRCADRVNKISEKARLAQGSNYYTDEHILVCISSSPTNAKIIRTATRMANAFKGRFTAIFVETPMIDSMSEKDKNTLRNNIRLAQQLGATIETVYGDDVALQIAEFARLSGVSKVVVGRNSIRKKFIFGKSSLTERLTVIAPNLDVYIIPNKENIRYRAPKAVQPKAGLIFKDITKTIIILIVTTIIGFIFYDLKFSEVNIITIYILSVLITAIATTERIYSMISSVLSVLIFNFFFTEPRYTFNVYDSGYPTTFLIMFLSAFITGTFAVRIKRNAKQSAEMAYRTKILLETNQLLQKEKEKSGIISVTANQLTKLLNKDIVFYSTNEDKLCEPIYFPINKEDTGNRYLNDNEKAVAAWVFNNNKHAGATTNTLGNAKCLYLAIRVNEIVYGVVGITIDNDPLDSFENNIVLSILGECGLALENEQVSRERQKAAILAKNEQLRANLLRSISHDLRTPLTGISGNAAILISNEETLSKDKKKQLYTDIYDDSLWLINLVENLLSVTRIEDGSMKLNMTTELMDEVVNEALQHINRRSVDHIINVTQSHDFILAKMDVRLIMQVIINIVDNAIKYTPVGSKIDINITKENKLVSVKISDNGSGISDEDKKKIFDMFFTANTKIFDSGRSLGLGLALCKSIIVAHSGELSVYDNKPKGTTFCFTLPVEEVELHE